MDVFDVLLKDNCKGWKSGKGFYIYKGSKKKEVDKFVYKLLKLILEFKLNDKEIVMCCLLFMFNEVVCCFDEGIICSVCDGDMGVIFGIGFLLFLGGFFCYMDMFGLIKVVEMMN